MIPVPRSHLRSHSSQLFHITERRMAGIVTVVLLACVTTSLAGTTAITGATVIDGTGADPITDGVIVITDDRITAVGSSREVVVPSTATVIPPGWTAHLGAHDCLVLERAQ